MNSKDTKDIRKQLRNVVKEIMPEVMKSQLGETLLKELTTVLNIKMRDLETQVRTALQNIDNRAKDLQSLMLREMVAKSTPVPEQELEKIVD